MTSALTKGQHLLPNSITQQLLHNSDSKDEDFWPCPQGMIWNSAEKADPEKRKCESCGQVCWEKVHRVFEMTRVRNFCSKECYDIA